MKRNSLEEEITDYVIKFKDNHYRLAYSYVKNSEDAMDIVQESIYKAFSSIDSLKNPSYIKTWFYRIIVNTSLDFLRKKKRVVVVEEDTLCRYDSGQVDKYEDFDLKLALDDLPNQYRSVIILRYFEDLKLKEVAEILDENVNTVKTRLYKGLEKLQIKMKNENKLISNAL
ncbi:sigma-70 family RNA polymerase sigma factor [Maledivibacter halophilus]|uniref:RNA polymerase, sigma subunit, SigV n=1 Tax=Maledivibacter halophilus TaxID=36842 RepID=A0A1T5L1X6_9FIRM|nr:sigma-70 family RNA polymerase sigma factor [Maledivibacter halophilus]SKC69408.1 RNA polymerase, sigma subunit, SigV [Maledivibacter halophilus]